MQRILVLRSAGYSVKLCPSLPFLDSALQSPEKPDAITVSGTHAPACHDAIVVVHAQCSAPIILFQQALYLSDEAEFDLVIPSFTPSHRMARQNRSHHRALPRSLPEATSIHEQSSVLREELTVTRNDSIEQRERSRRLRSEGKTTEQP